jgi:hypothetical protein
MLRACRRDLGARGSYDLGSCDRLQDHQEAAGIVFKDAASALFGVEGLRVTDVQAGPGGVLEVWAVTDYPDARAPDMVTCLRGVIGPGFGPGLDLLPCFSAFSGVSRGSWRARF